MSAPLDLTALAQAALAALNGNPTQAPAAPTPAPMTPAAGTFPGIHTETVSDLPPATPAPTYCECGRKWNEDHRPGCPVQAALNQPTSPTEPVQLSIVDAAREAEADMATKLQAARARLDAGTGEPFAQQVYGAATETRVHPTTGDQLPTDRCQHCGQDVAWVAETQRWVTVRQGFRVASCKASPTIQHQVMDRTTPGLPGDEVPGPAIVLDGPVNHVMRDSSGVDWNHRGPAADCEAVECGQMVVTPEPAAPDFGPVTLADGTQATVFRVPDTPMADAILGPAPETVAAYADALGSTTEALDGPPFDPAGSIPIPAPEDEATSNWPAGDLPEPEAPRVDVTSYADRWDRYQELKAQQSEADKRARDLKAQADEVAVELRDLVPEGAVALVNGVAAFEHVTEERTVLDQAKWKARNKSWDTGRYAKVQTVHKLRPVKG